MPLTAREEFERQANIQRELRIRDFNAIGDDRTNELIATIDMAFKNNNDRTTSAAIALSPVVYHGTKEILQAASTKEGAQSWFRTYLNDPKWKAYCTGGLKVASSGLAALWALFRYAQQNLNILTTDSLPLSQRVGKFVAGALFVTASSGTMSAALMFIGDGLCHLIARFAPRLIGATGAKFLGFGVGPAISCFFKMYFHFKKYRQNKLTSTQLLEWFAIDIMEGGINCVLMLLGATTGPLIGIPLIVISTFAMAYVLEETEKKQEMIGMNPQGEGPGVFEIFWSSMCSTVGMLLGSESTPEDTTGFFTCPITLQVMRKPALLNGHYYEYSAIYAWVNEHNEDILHQPAHTNDIKIDQGMKDLVERWIWACNHN